MNVVKNRRCPTALFFSQYDVELNDRTYKNAFWLRPRRKNYSLYFLFWFFNFLFCITLILWWKCDALAQAMLYSRKISEIYGFENRQLNNNSWIFSVLSVSHDISVVKQKSKNISLNTLLQLKSCQLEPWWKKWSQQLRRNRIWTFGCSRIFVFWHFWTLSIET